MTTPTALRRLEVLRDAMPDVPARDVLASSIAELADLINLLETAGHEAAEEARRLHQAIAELQAVTEAHP